MAGIAALHESKIVHADLKPANAYLIEDPTIGSGYQLKLIDMDFSVLADRRAPWHGTRAMSARQLPLARALTRGAVPGLASDVFTCGLMLYELLAGASLLADDQAEYARLVRATRRSRPRCWADARGRRATPR
jgi:serine/threonine protein kinase